MTLKTWVPVVTATDFVKGNSLFSGSYSVDESGRVSFVGRLQMGSTAVLGEGATVDVSLPVPVHAAEQGVVTGTGYVDATAVPTLLRLGSNEFRVYYRAGGEMPTAEFLVAECSFVFAGSYWRAV